MVTWSRVILHPGRHILKAGSMASTLMALAVMLGWCPSAAGKMLLEKASNVFSTLCFNCLSHIFFWWPDLSTAIGGKSFLC